jgi:subtilisin family serine protease
MLKEQYPCLIQKGRQIYQLKEDYFVYLQIVSMSSTMDTPTCLDISLIDHNSYCIKYVDYELLIPQLAAPPPSDLNCLETHVFQYPLEAVYRWHLDLIDGSEDDIYTHTDTSGFDNVDVYVLDSGIRETHFEFSQVQYTLMDPSYPVPINGHGTHAAGIVVGRTCGIASHDLYDYPVCRYDTRWWVDRIDDSHLHETAFCAFEHMENGFTAVMQRLQSTGRRGVVLMAFGRSLDANDWHIEWFNDRLSRIVDAGGIIVAAAGNTASDACNHYPAASPYALSIGAHTHQYKVWYQGEYDSVYVPFSQYGSNYGSCVDIYAPGYGIVSAWHENDDEYATLTGTSMAASVVTGLASILLSKDNTLTQDEIKSILQSNTKTVLQCPLPPCRAVIFGCQ